MTDLSEIKRQIINAIKMKWKSDGFSFHSTPRSEGLRDELISRMLSAVMTDDERAQLYNLKPGCRMRENAKIINPSKFDCGDYVWIGEGVILDASGGLKIGDHTTVGSNSFVWSHSSAIANLKLNNKSGNPYIIRKETRIGNGVFIGGPSVIYPGVTIADKCIILPMSVVTKDVPTMTISAGSPAKVISEIDDAYINSFIEKWVNE